MARKLSLRKARHIMKAGYHWYRKKGKKLTPENLALFESHLQLLDQALLAKDRDQADLYARKVEEFCKINFKKSAATHSKELIVALCFALIVAIIVRQMWFELYEIPTGSMRPTYQEKDHLTVSKTQFGINRPLMPGHFNFDPSQVKRSGVIIFLGDNLPIDDATSYYFNAIPYSKRFIKRLIAKPGDTVYFYGGKVYGMDADEEPLMELLESPWMEPLEYIPFLNYTGRTSVEGNQLVLRQMDIPVGRLSMTPYGAKGEVFNGSEWVLDKPVADATEQVSSYSDLWGIRNFAMARLLTEDEVNASPAAKTLGGDKGMLYLELSHHPTLSSRESALHTERTLIPLQQQHLDTIRKHLYTTRFVVESGRARPYSASGLSASPRDPAFPGVPDGVYQIDRGNVQRVAFGGMLEDLPADHPLYGSDPKLIQKLFNLGVDFNTAFQPTANSPFPNRYAYFRNGALYLLNAPLLEKDDPALIAFNKREAGRQEKGDYIAFQDYGPPKDRQFMRTFGLKVPEGYYLVLGDNHAVSGDSRVMGFIPEKNLRGVPDLLLWPPGSRWLAPEETPYPFFTTSRLVVWGIIALIALGYFCYHRRKIKQPIFKKIK